ncbi:MAG: threonine--tRNA ligase, partial [Halobacteria archaeon]|nr:threonine--tRNA ligase [Halobacteria archaeon]
MSVKVELPDSSIIEVKEGTTVEEVAYEIGEGLGRDTVAGKMNGELVAKEEPIEEDCSLEIVTEDSDEYIDALRHTAAHVFAQALQRLYPEAKLTIGPWTDEGFYYDITGVNLDKDDLQEIEEEMEKIVDEDLDVERIYMSRDEAEEYYEDNEFKLEILENEASDGDRVSFYKQGEFIDLCKGPHVDSTGEINAFKLLNIAAAYWRGNEENEMLTRVYGTAFPSQDELEEFLERREEAKKRDHRRIGSEMNLFSIQETTGPGLPLYHPKGKRVLNQLKEFIKELNRERGCEEVETPHLFRTELWRKSGHYDNYKDDMFLFELGDDEFGLKPMNCPGHAMIYRDQVWSYRDLPVRYTEQGKVYRKEQRGELSGLSRVWAFTIDDGHLFLRPDQIDGEVKEILRNIFHVLETFELEYELALATQPEKYVGSDELWDRAESQLKEVLEDMGLEYDIEEGDGAFYGPKIDFAFTDALGREWDGPTVQLDFNMPERLDLSYVTEDNEEERPVMIHRALYGS